MWTPLDPDTLWEEFRRRSLPASAPPIQLMEMRKAYLAGMLGALLAMHEIPDDADEDKVAEALDAWQTDILKRLLSAPRGRG